MFIYLAIAIDRNTSKADALPGILSFLRTEKDGTVVYLPSKAFSVSGHGNSEKQLVSVNKYALSKADALLVYYVPGVESWGVPIEMAYAKDHDIPIYLYSEESEGYEGFPIYLKDLVDREHCYKSMEALFSDMIGDVDETVVEKQS